MRIGQRVRVKTEDLIRELLQACGWAKGDYVAGTIDDVVGHRVCVMVDERQYWFNDEFLEKDNMQPNLPGLTQ